MMATYNNNNAHPLPSAPVGGAQMQPPPPNPQYQQQYQQQQYQQPQQQYQQRPQQQQQQPQPQPPLPELRRESQTSAQRPSVSQGGRPKSRTFSFRSDKSQKSGPVNQKLEPETHAEKEAKRLHSKADPTMAIIEAEPSAVAATVKSSLAPLRSITHRDSYGNPIAEPDKSNPTRSRWERPLDTIRSFEAAIDGGYNRKSSYPSDNESASFSRRNSYFTHNNNSSSARFPQDSYYGRPQSYMPTSNSAYDLRQGLHGRETPHDQGGYNPNNMGNPNNGNGYGGYGQNGPGPRQRYSRIASEPQIHGHLNRPVDRPNEQNIYPIPNNHRSYETVASGSGSGTSGEPAGYQTDLTSSDNSSIERRQSPAKPQLAHQQPQQQPPANDYGIGFSQGPAYGAPNGGGGYNGGYSGYSNGGPKQAPPTIQLSSPLANGGGAPMPPQKNVLVRKPTNLASAPPPPSLTPPAAADKRKSWFSRRFSRQN